MMRRVEPALLVVRSHRDFPSGEDNQRWVREVIERKHNAVPGEKLARNGVNCARYRRWRCRRTRR